MDTLDALFILSNTAFVMGTALLARKVIKNRNYLNDFDMVGSCLTEVGMLTTSIILIILHQYITLILSVPTVIFWMVASIYTTKKTLKRRN